MSFNLMQQVRQRLTAQAKSNLCNSIWGGIDFTVTTLSVFLLIPVLLKTVGQEMFGVMVIVNTLMGFSGVFGFGLGQATLKYVADYRASDNWASIAEVIRTTLWVYCITGLFACLLIFYASGWLAESVFRVSSNELDDAISSIRMGGFGFLGFLIFGVAENAFKGFEQFKRPVVVRSIVRTLTLGGQIALAVAGMSLSWLVALQVGLYFIGALVLFICLRRELVPNLNFYPWISIATLKNVFSYGVYTYLSGVFGMIRQNGDTLLVGAILGPSALAIYTIPIRLLSQVHALLSRAYGYLFPYVAKLYAQGDTAGLERTYDRSTFQIATISVGIITPIAIFAYEILQLWLGAEVASEAGGVAQVMALRFAIFPLSIVNSYFLMGSGKVQVMAGVTAVNAVLSLTVIGVCAYYFGIWGAALGQLSVFVPVFINRCLIEKQLFDVQIFMRIFVPPMLLVMPLLFCLSMELVDVSSLSVLYASLYAIVLAICSAFFVLFSLLSLRRLKPSSVASA